MTEENDMCISMTSLVCDSYCKKANNCMGYTACNGCGMPSCPACDLDENGYCDRCSEDRFNCALCDENLPLTDSVEVSGVFTASLVQNPFEAEKEKRLKMNFMVNVSFAGKDYPLEFTEDFIMYHGDHCGTEVIGSLLTGVPGRFLDYRITFMEYFEHYKITCAANNEPVKLRCMKLFIKWEKGACTMKTKKFTASQYRRMEAVVASGEIGEKTRIEVALMLKQAAELAMESNRENLMLVEYNPRFFNKNGRGTGRSVNIFHSYEAAKYHGERIASKSEKVKVFSREVSEWKEVKDGE